MLGRKISHYTILEDTHFLYKISAQGGQPERLCDDCKGMNVQESKDGEYLYFFAGDTDALIHVMPIGGGAHRALPAMSALKYPTDWALARHGIYFLNRDAKSAGIDFYDFATSKVRNVVHMQQQFALWGGMSLSSDESRILFARIDGVPRDIMLVENFK